MICIILQLYAKPLQKYHQMVFEHIKNFFKNINIKIWSKKIKMFDMHETLYSTELNTTNIELNQDGQTLTMLYFSSGSRYCFCSYQQMHVLIILQSTSSYPLIRDRPAFTCVRITLCVARNMLISCISVTVVGSRLTWSDALHITITCVSSHSPG